MDETFGRRLTSATTSADRLAIEGETERREPFAAVDALIERLLMAGLSGERIVVLSDQWDDETITLPALDENDLAAVEAHVDVEEMERRGAWALPERETLTAGWANFGWWVREEPRFVGSLADDDRRKITLRGNPTGTFAWAALTPVFDLLCVPHDLRSGKAGKADSAAQAKAWKPLDAMLEACDIELSDELAVFRPGGGWTRLTAEERAAARVRLVEGWARRADPVTASRLRMWMLGTLIDRFYAKAKTATPTSRQALTRAHWRTLVAFFGGDWLALLAYLGEQPNPGEEIAGTLPEPKLFVGGSDRARRAAAQAGVDSAEVERMLSAFFGSQDATSPVEHRVASLRRIWVALDELYASHAPQQGSLWGLLDELNEVHDSRFDDQYRKGLYRELLPADLNAEILQLWGTEATTKNPDRLTSRWLPHHGVWDTFGAAVQLWHELALTAFAHTETTGYNEWGLSELRQRHSWRLEQLAAAGCPVDPALFSELAEAGRALGPIEYEQHKSRIERDGISVELSFGGGERLKRPGYEKLRDLITGHRRAWAQEHLERWLEHRWQTDLRAAAETFNRALVAKGKAPTTRQSIRASQPALDRWFAGDIRALLSAIGQSAPAGEPVYERHLPADPYAFSSAVEHALGGGLPEPDMVDWSGDDPERLAEFRRISDHNSARYYAAFAACRYVQAWEALGRRPEIKEVRDGKRGASLFRRDDPEGAWLEIEQAILKVLADPAPAGVVRSALPNATSPTPRAGAGAREVDDGASREDGPESARPEQPSRRGLLGRMFGGREEHP